MIISLFFSLAFGQTLVLGPDTDMNQLSLIQEEQLISTNLIKKFVLKDLRSEILKDSEDYLNQKISDLVYFSNLNRWNLIGWSEVEKQIVLDTIQKSNADKNLKKEWLCRLGKSLDCSKKIKLAVWPEYLKYYDWIIIGGTAYPKNRWDSIEIVNFETRFVFVSSKFKTIDLISVPSDLKLPVLPPETWVNGHCEKYQVLSEIQSLETTVIFSQNCQKPTIVKVDAEPSFYKRHKEKIWWTALGIAVLGTVTMSGKKIVFTY